jgi:MFS family permease
VAVRGAVRDPRFWYLLTAGFGISLTVSALIAHQLSFLEERGWHPQRAAAAIGAIGLWQVGGRMVFAPLARWASSRVVTVAVYASEVVALVVLAVSSAPPAIWTFVALTGVSRGMHTLVRATLVGELFGTASYGAIAARVALASTVAQAIGPILGSALRRGPGGYTTMLWVLTALAVVSTGLASRIERPARV